MSKTHQNVDTNNHQTEKTSKSKTATSMSKSHQNIDIKSHQTQKTSK